MTTEKTSKIYLDIASLFDLRHSALYQVLGEEESIAIATAQPYNIRECDEFPGVDSELLQRFLASADLRMLEHAPMSYIQIAVASKVKNIERRNTFMAESTLPEVVLNIHPFELTTEQCEMLQNALFVKIDTGCKVTIVREHPRGLTPHFLKNSGFIACFMYDLHDWLQYHAKAVQNADLKEVMMYFAGIYKNKPTKEEAKVFTKLGFKEVFSYTEYLFTGRMQLNFLPVFMYSSLITATVFLQANEAALKPDQQHTPKDNSI